MPVIFILIFLYNGILKMSYVISFHYGMIVILTLILYHYEIIVILIILFHYYGIQVIFIVIIYQPMSYAPFAPVSAPPGPVSYFFYDYCSVFKI